MSHRSKQFPTGSLEGLAQTYGQINDFASNGLEVQDEVMAGKRYRRQLHPDTVAAGMDVDYLLQATFLPPAAPEGRRFTASYFVDESRRLLSTLDLPGDIVIDQGGLEGFDETLDGHAFGSTGETEADVTRIFPPWLKSTWSEDGRTLMFFCGIHAPLPKRFLDERAYDWDRRLMRQGLVVFQATPEGLETH